MEWQIKHFNQLSTHQLVEIYKQRVAVFVVEQHCAYQEIDDQDLLAWHLFCTDQSSAITAYCRIIPKENKIYIGRILVSQQARGTGLAKQLMQQALQFIAQQWQGIPIALQAQAYLQDFYQSFGFKPISAIYLEDGIEHLDMLK
ncbi:GNAT family N-acetyltransferase [Volucribacter amazonae]|uniref:GCN5 family acetyltransferase n=1 Tax=Volucribacter amazonae TaxID=256731 RepID=A0A9X4PBG4_9PAST|nr:GNAT family N-acetyltransferase [Volucribacter amazonae]MDG6895192.1 GCN5 family acetyltransferase [Volucribacter amazonae]